MISFFKYKNLPFLLLLIVGIFFIYKAFYFLPHDFANYYYGAFFLENGNFNTQVYYPTWFNLEIAKHTENVFGAYAPNTPFLSLFFLPLTIFSFVKAKLIFNFFSLILFIISIYRLLKFYKINTFYVILILFLLFIPFKNNILFGQVYFLLFFLISEGFLNYKKGNYKLMSVWWSFAILLKVFPILLFLFLLIEKKWKSSIYLALSLLIIFSISLYFNGWESWQFYFLEILPKASNGEISDEFVKNYQSFLMFLKHLFIENDLNNNLLLSSSLAYKIALLFSKFLILSCCIYYTSKQKCALKKFSIWIIAFYLLSPYSSSYGSLLLILPIISMVKNNSKNQFIIFSILLFIYSNLPFSFFNSENLVLNYFKLFAISLFFYLFFLSIEIKLKNKIKLIGLSFFLAIGISFVQKETISIDKYEVLSANNIAFVTDYTIKKENLTYTYWSINGLQKQTIKTEFTPKTTSTAKIKNNNIYVNNQLLPLPKSNKRKPILLNDNTLVYLSDFGRGYGFYKLIKINIDE